MQHNGAQFFVFLVSSQAHVQQNSVTQSSSYLYALDNQEECLVILQLKYIIFVNYYRLKILMLS